MGLPKSETITAKKHTYLNLNIRNGEILKTRQPQYLEGGTNIKVDGRGQVTLTEIGLREDPVERKFDLRIEIPVIREIRPIGSVAYKPKPITLVFEQLPESAEDPIFSNDKAALYVREKVFLKKGRASRLG